MPFGADGNDSGKVHVGGIRRNHGQKRLFFHGVDLIDDEDGRRTGGLALLDQGQLLLADVCNRLDDEQNRVDVDNRFLHNIDHIVAEFGARAMEARRVDEDELRILAVQNGTDAVARGLRLMGNDCEFFADERVCQRGFSDVWPARNRNHGGFCFHSCSPSYARGSSTSARMASSRARICFFIGPSSTWS